MNTQCARGTAPVQLRETAMDRLPEEILCSIFSYLSPKHLGRCSSVCQKWNRAAENNTLWERLFLSKFKDFLADDLLEIAAIKCLVKETSWKFAFNCCLIFLREDCPPFWNDIDLYKEIQKKKKLKLEQIKSIPVNGLLWIMLQLKMEKGGVSSSLAASRPTQNALALKQQALLSVAHQFSHDKLLYKLKEIADVPHAKTLTSTQPHATSFLLTELSHGCVPQLNTDNSIQAPSKKGCFSSSSGSIHPWPHEMDTHHEWDTQFTAPVQDAVIQVLQYWSHITGKRQLRAMPFRNSLLLWLKRLAEQKFWVGNRNKAVAEIWQKTSKKAEQLEETQAELVSQRTRARARATRDCTILITIILIPDWTTSQLSDLDFLKEITERSAKDCAARLSAESFRHYHDFSTLDIMAYLTSDDENLYDHPAGQYIWHYSEGLHSSFTAICHMEKLPKKKKVEVVHYIIDVCTHLKVFRDFMSLKILLSAVRTTVGQTQLTQLTWNDINIPQCKSFSQLDNFMTNDKCYQKYMSFVKKLKEPYVPYLPAHRQFCQQQLLQSSSPAPTLPDNLLAGQKQSCCVHPREQLCQRSKFQAQSNKKIPVYGYVYTVSLEHAPVAGHIVGFKL